MSMQFMSVTWQKFMFLIWYVLRTQSWSQLMKSKCQNFASENLTFHVSMVLSARILFSARTYWYLNMLWTTVPFYPMGSVTLWFACNKITQKVVDECSWHFVMDIDPGQGTVTWVGLILGWSAFCARSRNELDPGIIISTYEEVNLCLMVFSVKN